MPYFTEVTAPGARAQTSANLLASAVQDSSGDGAWMNGASWIGELCPELEIVDPCAELDDSAPASGGAWRYASPLGYRMRARCTTMAGPRSFPVVRDRLARQAEAIASFAVARELAEGAGATANPFDGPGPGDTGLVNQYFADADAETITGATSILDALGLLEQEARDRTKGMQVFLHIPIRIATQVAAQLNRVGPELRTHTDAVVIADAGYTGKGPGAAAGIWGYATGPVFAKLGPVAVTDEAAATIDRRTNTQEIWADRMFLAGFDPCCQLAIQFPEP
jgi:hypothetical protein